MLQRKVEILGEGGAFCPRGTPCRVSNKGSTPKGSLLNVFKIVLGNCSFGFSIDYCKQPEQTNLTCNPAQMQILVVLSNWCT